MSGAVIWFTGMPSSGKSTLAKKLFDALETRGVASVVLDGDAVREAIVPRFGYDDESRANFYETLARLAALVASQGRLVLVPATAHKRVFRERARELAPRFFEVFVDTPLSECARRDAKGLYRANTPGLPGSSVPFEKPEAPDFVVMPEAQNAIERLADAVCLLRESPLASTTS